MMKTKILGLVLTTTAVLGVATPNVALATDPQNVSIPASACQLAYNYESDEAYLVNGSWVHTGGTTGVFTLFCPIGRKPDGGTWTFDRMRVWYRDPDGVGVAYRVTAELFEREPLDIAPLELAEFISNDFDDVDNTTKGEDLDLQMLEPALYFIRVEVHRANVNEQPAFHGIDFKTT